MLFFFIRVHSPLTHLFRNSLCIPIIESGDRLKNNDDLTFFFSAESIYKQASRKCHNSKAHHSCGTKRRRDEEQIMTNKRHYETVHTRTKNCNRGTALEWSVRKLLEGDGGGVGQRNCLGGIFGDNSVTTFLISP